MRASVLLRLFSTFFGHMIDRVGVIRTVVV